MRNKESDTDLGEKGQIYSYIAQFLQEKFQAPIEICLRAAYLLGNESDESLIGAHAPSDESQKLAESAKRIIITIKAHYEILQKRGISNRTIEIFSINPPNKNLSVTRIENEIAWENLPEALHGEFLIKDQKKLTYEIY